MESISERGEMFIKFPHVARIGTDEAEGLLIGECFVFPKIDGTNASIWLEEDGLHAGSRNRELSLDEDNAGFLRHILDAEADLGFWLWECFRLNPNWTLYGEWLVPHSLKTYREDAWRKFYVFDVFNREHEAFIPYEYYLSVLEDNRLNYIPLLERVINPSIEHLQKKMLGNTFLIRDGAGVGEGIVIKRYDFVNCFGRTQWGKLVRNEFKEENAKVFGVSEVVMKPLEEKIAKGFITIGRVQKVVAKMKSEKDVPMRTRIPELFGRVWYDLITEEMWEILKKHKKATIDFRKLHQFVVLQIKACLPEMFGGGK